MSCQIRCNHLDRLIKVFSLLQNQDKNFLASGAKKAEVIGRFFVICLAPSGGGIPALFPLPGVLLLLKSLLSAPAFLSAGLKLQSKICRIYRIEILVNVVFYTSRFLFQGWRCEPFF